MSERQKTLRVYDSVARKWRDLAERRRQHYIEMYESGRWRHYYTEDQFLVQMREVTQAVEAWAKIVGPTEPQAVPEH